MKSIQQFFFVLVILSVGYSPSIAAVGTSPHELPLYEYGIGGLASLLPHYRGSDEYELWALPLPYFVYRGEKLKADREGVRGIFWRNDKWQTDVSLNGNPPVPDDNEAREGMGGLDALIEVGPALRYYFFEFGSRDRLFAQLSFRGAFSVGWDDGPTSSYEGNTTEVSIAYHDSRTFAEEHIWFHLDAAVKFSDSQLDSYFYDVAPAYVTDQREQYSAGAGYAGYHISASLFKDLTEQFIIGFFARWTNIDGAVYEDSPLVKESNNVSAVAMLFWKLGRSEEMVK